MTLDEAKAIIVWEILVPRYLELSALRSALGEKPALNPEGRSSS